MGEREFARAIRLRRDTLGLSQARLGELVGRSASTIRNWERGRSLPSSESDVRTLAAVLGVDEGELMTDAGFDVADDESPVARETRPTMEQVYASLSTAELDRLDIDRVGERPAEPAEPPETEETPDETQTASVDEAQPEGPPSELFPDDADQAEPAHDGGEGVAEALPGEWDEEAEPGPDESQLPVETEDPIPPGVVEAPIPGEADQGDVDDLIPDFVEQDTGDEPAPPPEDPGASEDDTVFEPDFEAAPEDVVAPEDPWMGDAGVPPSLDWARPDGAPPAQSRSPEPRRLGRAAPPTVLERAPAGELSYLEDPDERQRYRLRALITAALVVGLVIVLLWSFDRATDILGSLWDEITGMLSV